MLRNFDGAPYCQAAYIYAQHVVNGHKLACKEETQACQRFLDDLARDEFAYVLDYEKAEAACEFIEALPHTKGKWAARKQNITLEPWQVFIVVNLFGWVDEAGHRRFREAYLRIPRKNGKSLLAAAIGVYMFSAGGEFGAEVYSGATSERQAWEVFLPAKLICQRTPELCEATGISVNAKTLSREEDGSKFQPMIGKPGDGASPSLAIIDEYHEHDADDMVETMRTGMGARSDPLLLVITTSGSNHGGPCYLAEQEHKKLLDGVFQDEQQFAIMYGIDSIEHRDIIQSYQAIKRLDYICKKNGVSITLKNQWLREAIAAVAIQHGGEKTLKKDAEIIQIGQQGRGSCAGHVTKECCGNETRNTETEKTNIAENGQKRTPKTLKEQIKNTEKSPGNDKGLMTLEGRLSTVLQQKSIPSVLRSAVEDAKSAIKNSRFYASTIATIAEELEGYCVNDAMLELVFWEITQRVYLQHSTTLKNQNVILKDNSLQVVYPPDDWTTEDALIKANPNYDISVSAEFLQASQQAAIRNSLKQNAFKRKHLNQWVGAHTAWLNMEHWHACADESLKIEDFYGQECVFAIDLASRIDITAFLQVFCKTIAGKRHYYAFSRFYLPEDTVYQDAGKRYEAFVTDGLITATDGEEIDFNEIEQNVVSEMAHYSVSEIVYDPWRANQMAQGLINQGAVAVEFRNTVANMSPAMYELEAAITSGRFHHDGNAVLTWMASNVVAKVDAKDNIYPRKERVENKIDGVVALIMAVGRAMHSADNGLDDFLANPVGLN